MTTPTRLYYGEVFEYRGHTFRVEFPRDDTSGAPWEMADGHRPVSEWVIREAREGEKVLCGDWNHYRYYDFEQALRIAIVDEWGTADGPQPGESTTDYRTRAVEADFEYLRAWCNDEWSYVGVVVTLDGDDERASLWGIESSDVAYLTEVAYEMADEIIARIEVDNPDVQLSEN